MNPFDVVSDISTEKTGTVINRYNDSDYNSFMVNRALSYHFDSIMQVNVTNAYHDSMPNYIKYDFLLRTIRKKRRYSKWAKQDPDSSDFSMVQEYYKVGRNTALQYLKLLTPTQLQEMRRMKGGLVNE